jgi:hypothetical protein
VRISITVLSYQCVADPSHGVCNCQRRIRDYDWLPIHFPRARPLSSLEEGVTVSSNNAERVAECSGSGRLELDLLVWAGGGGGHETRSASFRKSGDLITLVSQRRKPGRWNLDRLRIRGVLQCVLCRSAKPRPPGLSFFMSHNHDDF